MKYSNKKGQTLVEYMLILAFISVVAIVIVQAFQKSNPANLETKRVINKISMIETEVRGWSETHFYAIAADGTATRIDLKTYTTLENGQFIKGHWENK